MQIVINISEYNREWISNAFSIPEEIKTDIAEAIINGTSLPERHGRLIDVDRLLRRMKKIATEEWKMKVVAPIYLAWNQAIEDVDHAPTILEARRGLENVERRSNGEHTNRVHTNVQNQKMPVL